MILLDGLATSQKVRDELKAKIAQGDIESPHLVVILVGDDPGSQVYVRNKEKACAYVGIKSTTYRLPADTKQEDLMALIQNLNNDKEVDGILLQLPLPKGLNSQSCLELINPMKDVDGLHPENQGRLSIGLPGLRPCTPSGVMNVLKHYNIDPAGKHAVVIGRSNLVGKPVAVMLTAADATVTHCHSKTKNLKEICLQADILVAAIGSPKFVTADMVKPGAVVIDVGMNRLDFGLCGDVDFESVKEVASALTPVPKGIGPMTIAHLLVNTVETKRLQKLLKK